MRNIVFAADTPDEFWDTLKKRANDYFVSNKLSPFATTGFVIKMIVMLLLFIVPYIIILTGMLSGWQMWGCCVIIGFGMAGIGLCISHQAAHNAVFKNKKLNRVFSLSFNLVGISDYIWKIKHNVFHHAYTNVYELDEGLREGEILRLSPDAPYFKVHRWQHIYSFIAYAVFTVLWTFLLDIEKLWRYNGNGSRNRSVKHPVNELLLFWITKIYYIVIAFVLPFHLLDISVGQFIIGFMTIHVIGSLIVVLVFQVEHLTEETEHVSPNEEGKVNCSWAMTQLKGTTNFKARTKLFEWYVSGTNYQVEHHLFPNISAAHYPALSKIVQRTAKEFGLNYHCQPSFMAAIVSHYHCLKRFGRPNTSLKTAAA
jgi:linoleoyl-CoA desaturase